MLPLTKNRKTMLTENSNITVEGLVAKYRNYVKENCPTIYDGIDDCPIHAESERQLLVLLYSRVAGDHPDIAIIESLSEYVKDYNDLYSNALSDEELSYLCDHFSEVSEYLFSFRKKWCGRSYFFDDPVTQEKYKLVKEYINPQIGDSVFVANSACCDIASLFTGCVIYGFTGYFGMDKECWALGQIRLYAAGIKSKIVSGEYTNGGYSFTLPDNKSFDYIIITDNTLLDIISLHLDLCSMYNSLKVGGKMLVFSEQMIGKSVFRDMVTKEKVVSSIISFEDDMLFFDNKRVGHTLLIIDKILHDTVEIISLSTNRRKTINADSLSASCFCPGYYMVERPSNGIPLSKIAKVSSMKEELSIFKKQLGGEIKIDKEGKRIILPEWMLSLSVASLNDLSTDFKDANLCNKPLHKVSDPSMDKLRIRIRCVNQPCVMLGTDGKSFQRLRVGFFDNVAKDTYARLTSACLIPKGNIDVRYLCALLLSPEVREQILSICDGDPVGPYIRHLPDLVIVPKHNKTERNMFLANALNDALKSSREELVQQHEQYKKSVRMRKHALTQSLSSIEVMFYALNKYRQKQNGIISDTEVISKVKGTTVKEAFAFLERNIKDMMPTLEHIADVEYYFNNPEWIDPEKFTEEYILKNEKGWLNFKPVITWGKGHNLAETDIKDSAVGNVIISKGESINMLWFPRDALERVFNNIISNAQAHGFTDNSRHDYHMRFSWHTDEIAMFIEIENNGTAISDDIDTSSLLDYGVSSSLHEDGHNGIGCNEIDDIMHRFGGSVEIISTPDKEYKVKYVLKFNRSNTFGA